jgi:hypothetical protein
MKNVLRCAVACAVVSVVFASPAIGSEQSAKPPSHSHEATCSHEARGLKGEEHDKFVALCLKAHKATATHASSPALEGQQNRMKSCNEQAGKRDLHGDERRAFMSACLKGAV